MLMVRMVYADAAPDYCDEICMREIMWQDESSTAGLYKESSFGKLTFPEPNGVVVTVLINKMATDEDACPFWSIGDDADAAVRDQYPYIDPSQFDHQAYFIPKEIPARLLVPCTMDSVTKILSLCHARFQHGALVLRTELLHSRIAWDPTPASLKPTCVSSNSMPLGCPFSDRCHHEFRHNTEGL
jgi:hypothetical protein